VDVPVTITEPVDATISTVTGTPQTNPGFIDSWIEVWQGVFKLAANDDGAHSASKLVNISFVQPLMPICAVMHFLLVLICCLPI